MSRRFGIISLRFSESFSLAERVSVPYTFSLQKSYNLSLDLVFGNKPCFTEIFLQVGDTEVKEQFYFLIPREFQEPRQADTMYEGRCRLQVSTSPCRVCTWAWSCGAIRSGGWWEQGPPTWGLMVGAPCTGAKGSCLKYLSPPSPILLTPGLPELPRQCLAQRSLPPSPSQPAPLSLPPSLSPLVCSVLLSMERG